MMRATQRHGELVADLEAETAGLREPQMGRVRGLASADEAGLFGHKAQVLLVPEAFCLRQRQDTLVDAGMSVGVGRY
jgi:hypothetical protein